MSAARTKRFLTTGAALAALSLPPLGLAAQDPAPDAARAPGTHPCPMGSMMQGDGMMDGNMMSGGGMMGGNMMSGEEMGTAAMGSTGGAIPRAVMHDVVRYQPRHVLALRDTLALTPRQVREIESLALDPDATASDDAAEGAARDLEAAFAAERPDTAAVRAAAAHVFRVQADRHAAHIARAAAVRAMLSARQRDQLEASACSMMSSVSGAPR